MKKTMFILLAIMLVLGACVSNKSFKMQNERVQLLEARHNSQEAQLEMARKDIIGNREQIEELIVRLNGIDGQLEYMLPMQDQIDASAAEIVNLRQDITQLRTELSEAQAKNASLEKRLADLTDDTNDTFDAFTDYLRDVNAKSSGFATKEELEQVISESALLAQTLDEITMEIEAIHQELDQQESLDIESEMLRQQEMDSLRARIDVLQDQLQAVQKEVTSVDGNFKGDLSGLRAKVESVSGELQTLTRDLEQVIAKERAAAEQRRLQTMNKQYKAALAEYNARNYENSILLFEDFLNAYPDSPLAANAHYWTAENYYAAGVFAKALREFQNVASLYPDTDKGWDAQMKAGLTYYHMGDKQAAAEELMIIKNMNPKYPGIKTVDKYLKLAQQ